MTRDGGIGVWPFYPDDWPRCVVCGEPALTGHLTCGRVACDEGEARDAREDES